ncbi:hypothetical protein ACA910_015470 [Epithemia clementina (nom. ined.)]
MNHYNTPNNEHGFPGNLGSENNNPEQDEGGTTTRAPITTRIPCHGVGSVGDHEELSQLPELRARIRRHVHTLILQQAQQAQQQAQGQQNCISPQQSQAYFKAMQTCPDLVQTETDALQFVRYCRYQLVSGAQRLCLYWTERQNLFGPERAFLPLTYSGHDSALGEEDLLTLRAAFPAMLPPTTDGLPCLLLEPKWKVLGTCLDHVLRALFYLFATMAQDEDDDYRTQVQGIHCLFIASTPRSPKVDWECWHRIYHYMANVFPVRLHKMHLVGIPHQKHPFRVIGQTMAATTNAFGQHFVGPEYQHLLQVHIETTPKQVLKELMAAGLTKQGIPTCLGGDWTLQDFSVWCRTRSIRERSKSCTIMTTTTNGTTSRTTTTAATSIMAFAKAAASSAGSSTSCDSSHPAVSYYYPETAAAAATFGGTSPLLLATNTTGHNITPSIASATSSTETQAEVGWIAAAATAAAAVRAATPPSVPEESEHDKTNKRRMANLISSRRKRERQHERVRLLQQESSELVQEHERLRLEQDQLQALLRQAEDQAVSLSAGSSDGTTTTSPTTAAKAKATPS